VVLLKGVFDGWIETMRASEPVVHRSMNAQHAGGYDDRPDYAANDVTAVTSASGDRFAQRRADA
jgi:hypothetical protein